MSEKSKTRPEAVERLEESFNTITGTPVEKAAYIGVATTMLLEMGFNPFKEVALNGNYGK